MNGEDLVQTWLNDTGASNPAGELFVSGEFAEAEIACETRTGSGKCGTVCTGSYPRECC